MRYLKLYEDFHISIKININLSEPSKYREEDDSTFTHNDIEYSVNKALEIAESIPVEYIDTDKLSWILEYTDTDPERVRNADLSFPLLVSYENNIYYVLDGAHRLTKAVEENIKELPAKILSLDQLEQCKI